MIATLQLSGAASGRVTWMEFSGWRLLKIPDLIFFNMKELFGCFQILKSSPALFFMQEDASSNVSIEIGCFSIRFVAKFSMKEK